MTPPTLAVSCHPETGRTVWARTPVRAVLAAPADKREGSAVFGRSVTAFLGLALALLAVSGALHAADGATLTYRRIFKNSSPEFIEIKVSEDGPATYDIRQSTDDPEPQPFEISAPVRAKLFALAVEMHNFDGADLDVHRKVADLGQKTFRYEKGAEVHQAQYNYTTNHSASQLQAIFEGLAQQLEDLELLQHRLKYDHLGVNDAITQFELHLNQRILPEPERLLPVLDAIAADAQLVELARTRARALAERIRASQPQTQ